jgi:hypothetical protein
MVETRKPQSKSEKRVPVTASGQQWLKHDDAVDALVYLILGLIGDGIEPQEIRYV